MRRIPIVLLLSLFDSFTQQPKEKKKFFPMPTSKPHRGTNIYGSVDSKRFQSKFPIGFELRINL